MTFDEIAALPVGSLAKPKSHLYLWCPNALLYEALKIMQLTFRTLFRISEAILETPPAA